LILTKRIALVWPVQGFLLAYLHFDSLVEMCTVKAIRTALDKLSALDIPSVDSAAYDSAYAAAMERIGSQSPHRAELGRQALAWIVHGRGPFTTLQLQEILGVEIGEHELDRDNCPDIDVMISACAELVTIDDEKQIIRLVHYTTQEYFDRTRQIWFPNAQAMITAVCTTLLSFKVCESAEFLTKFYSLSLVSPRVWSHNYAVRHWAYHEKRAPSDAIVKMFLTLARTSNVGPWEVKLRCTLHVTQIMQALVKCQPGTSVHTVHGELHLT
jgi:hypothetical protein